MNAISIGTSALVTGIITVILSFPAGCAEAGQFPCMTPVNALGLPALSQEQATVAALVLGLLGGLVAAFVISSHEAATRRQA